VLHRKYQHKGYTNTRTAIFEGSNGDRRSSINTVWTEKGRQFIHSIY
jgi:anti-repressor protein